MGKRNAFQGVKTTTHSRGKKDPWYSENEKVETSGKTTGSSPQPGLKQQVTKSWTTSTKKKKKFGIEPGEISPHPHVECESHTYI